MEKEYKTVEKENSAAFTEKKSEFIGYVCPVGTQQEAADFINKIKAMHRTASHNVYAYVLKENNIQRSSDDGEPGGTAGVPVLDVLLKEGLCNVCVVVTRYFGGILLGAGGLVRAYSHASKLAVEAGGIITMAPCEICEISVDYSFYEKMLSLLSSHGANIENTDFAERVNIRFTVKAQNARKLSDDIVQQSNGRYSATAVGQKFAKTE